MEGKKMKKRLATLVGCNYPNTRNELHGCINDVLAMQSLLFSRFGFDPCDVQLLTDAHNSPVLPTGTNIRRALQQMVDQAEPGDVLFFHYSGHGTRIPALKLGNIHRQDEAIVPCDYNLITDIDFRNLVNQLPEGASFTMLSDSCHSGGLIDKEKEQIGPSFIDSGSTPHHHPRQKSIPFDSILHHLASITGIDSLEISVHLLELFGNQASLKFQSLDLPSERSGLFKPVRLDNGILLSGCQANETSADANPTGDLTKAYGAFSNAVQLVMKEHCEVLSNKEVVTHARELLHAQGFKQHPCLYCSDGNENAPFLWKLESSST